MMHFVGNGPQVLRDSDRCATRGAHISHLCVEVPFGRVVARVAAQHRSNRGQTQHTHCDESVGVDLWV